MQIDLNWSYRSLKPATSAAASRFSLISSRRVPVDQIHSDGSVFNEDDFDFEEDEYDDDDLMMTAGSSDYAAHVVADTEVFSESSKGVADDGDGDEVATGLSEHGGNDETVDARSEQDVGEGEVSAVPSQHEAAHEAHDANTNALVAKLIKRGRSRKLDKGAKTRNAQDRIAVRFLGERDA